MRLSLITVLLPLAMGGCVGIRTVDSPAPVPAQAVIVAPSPAPAAVVVCSDGTRPPCL